MVKRLQKRDKRRLAGHRRNAEHRPGAETMVNNEDYSDICAVSDQLSSTGGDVLMNPLAGQWQRTFCIMRCAPQPVTSRTTTRDR